MQRNLIILLALSFTWLAAGKASASPLVLASYSNGTYVYALSLDPDSGTGIALGGTIALTGLVGVTGALALAPMLDASFTSDSVSVYAPYGYQISNTTNQPFTFDLFSVTSTVTTPGLVSYVDPAGYTTFSGLIDGPAAPEPSSFLLGSGLLLGLGRSIRRRSILAKIPVVRFARAGRYKTGRQAAAREPLQKCE